ncbi:hypothetical protein chiPu_0027878, partial [Chiloscyllium punctatum]|nr:hypothetical protein [Chiloscyllium punctatum]
MPEVRVRCQDRVWGRVSGQDQSQGDSDVISQDSGTGELGFDAEVPTVGQALTDVLKANDIDLTKLAQGPLEHIADGALEDGERYTHRQTDT